MTRLGYRVRPGMLESTLDFAGGHKFFVSEVLTMVGLPVNEPYPTPI